LKDAEFRQFIEVLCVACEANSNGETLLSAQNLAWRLRRRSMTALRKLIEVGLIYEEKGTKLIVVTSWEKYQFRSDSSKERVDKHRKNKKKCNVTETLPKRYSNGIEQNRNRIDTEQIRTDTDAGNVTPLAVHANDYVVVLEKYLPSFVFTQKNMRLGSLWLFWQGKGVMPEDVERAMDYAREMGRDVKSPFYIEDIAVQFAMHRREPTKCEAPKSKQAAADEAEKARKEKIRKAVALIEAKEKADASDAT
jgi:hypothetical protein